MVFNSDVFLFAFFPVVFALFWLARTRGQRLAVLALSGYVFYGYWDWRFCGLLAFSSLASFAGALAIARSTDRRTRRAWLFAVVGVDLAILGFFKYYNFGAASLAAVAPGFAPRMLDIVLPVGISFYTFHTISYVADVAAGRVRPTRDLVKYLAYVSLFPQLVAGPIVRYRQIEEDLDRVGAPLDEDHVARGIGFFVTGLIKKVVVADQIAALVDPMLASYGTLSVAGAWAAALGYTLQLYFDFSGYSDMAIATAGLLGYQLTLNFDYPYLASNIAEFWRKWHISLSTWLRDYLYIPLGGSRGSKAFTYRNLMLTMLLGGLWHGASWTFVIWGGLHGLGLIVHREYERVAGKAGAWWQKLRPIVGPFLCFYFVCITWVMFRAQTVIDPDTGAVQANGFDVARTVLKSIVLFHSNGSRELANSCLWFILALAILHWLASRKVFAAWWRRLPEWAYALLLGVGLGVSLLFVPQHFKAFIYFQF